MAIAHKATDLEVIQSKRGDWGFEHCSPRSPLFQCKEKARLGRRANPTIYRSFAGTTLTLAIMAFLSACRSTEVYA